MIWTGITSGTPIRTANAKALSGVLPGRSIAVRANHPGTGPDALVRIHDANGRTVAQIQLSAKRPVPPPDYFEVDGDPNQSYNYSIEPVGAVFPSPGITIQVDAPAETTPSTSTSSDGTTTFPGPVVDTSYLPVPSGVVGADDSVAINAAIASGGKWIAWPLAQYVIRNPIVVPSNTRLDMGTATITLASGVGKNMLRNKSADVQRQVSDANIAQFQSTITSATANFTAADVGRTVIMPTAGRNGIVPYTAIVLTVVNPTTITVSGNSLAAVTNGVLKIYDRDVNISVVGGNWDRQNNGGTGTDAHSLFFRHIDRLSVEIETYNATAGKYAIAIGDCTLITASGKYFKSSSDGIHFNGPCTNIRVPNAMGATGDDLISFTCADYPDFQDTAGDIIDVHVGTVFGVASKTCVRILAGGGRQFDRFSCDHIGGTTVTAPVVVGEDTTTAQTQSGKYGNIDLGMVSAVSTNGASAAVALISLAANAVRVQTPNASSSAIVQTYGANTSRCDLIEIDCSYPSSSLPVFRHGATAMTIGSLVIKGGYNGTGGLVVVEAAGATIEQLIIDSMNVNYTGTGKLIDAPSNKIGSFVSRDTQWNMPSGAGNIIGSAIKEVLFIGSRILNGAAIISGGSATQSNIRFASTFIDRATRLAAITGTAKIAIDNCRIDTLTNEAILITTGPLKITGSGNVVIGSFTLLGRTASEVVDVASIDLPVDLAILARTAGNMAVNGNAGLACGTGLALANGSAWKNLYSGATYP